MRLTPERLFPACCRQPNQTKPHPKKYDTDTPLPRVRLSSPEHQPTTRRHPPVSTTPTPYQQAVPQTPSPRTTKGYLVTQHTAAATTPLPPSTPPPSPPATPPAVAPAKPPATFTLHHPSASSKRLQAVNGHRQVLRLRTSDARQPICATTFSGQRPLAGASEISSSTPSSKSPDTSSVSRDLCFTCPGCVGCQAPPPWCMCRGRSCVWGGCSWQGGETPCQGRFRCRMGRGSGW